MLKMQKDSMRQIFNSLISKMNNGLPKRRSISSCAVNSQYEKAIIALNGLQSNAAYISQAIRKNNAANNQLEDTKKYLFRSGLTLEDLDRLSIIHVAGTKGKGSTCAFVESILSQHGFRTGFYSSPHLISVRERFRINCQSINTKDFVRHFWNVYNNLEKKKESENDMPQYFKFLTILMFHIFLNSNLDVAVIEVGIGGEFDCTNIIRNPVCVGITSLGLDHIALLGNTIEEIAFQKSGIFKSNVPAFTVPQLNKATSVLVKRALEKHCSLKIVPALNSYPWKDQMPLLGIKCNIQNYNASLAVQLSSCWIEMTNGRRVNSILKNCIDLDLVAVALQSCKWPGRTQILSGKTADFFVDGAHTLESIECCISWFQKVLAEEEYNNNGEKYLMFNMTGDRDTNKFLNCLKKLNFNKAFFLPNVAGNISSTMADQENINNPFDKQLLKCQENCELWGTESVLCKNVQEALEIIKKESSYLSLKPKILVTGSLHLVGALFANIDPNLSMKTEF